MEAKLWELPEAERDALFDEYEKDRQRLESKPRRSEGRDEVDAMRAAAPDLERLKRYERRARSGKRHAFARFMEMKFRPR